MDSYYDFETWEASLATRIGLVTTCGVLTLIGIVGNLIIPILVLTVKSLQSTVNRSLSVLCIADLIYLLYQPITTINWEFGKDDSTLGKHLCYFILFYEQGGVICSTMIFLFVSLERYIAICHPLVSLYYWSGNRTLFILAGIVLASIGLSFPTYAVSRYEMWYEVNETYTFCFISFEEPWIKVYYTVTETVSNFGSIPILLFIYISIIKKLLKNKPTDEFAAAQSQSRLTNRIRTVIMLLTAVTVFIVCRLPRVVLEIISIHFPDIYHIENALVHRESYIIYWISWLLLFINSQANPFIIFLMSTAFRKALCSSFQKCGRKTPQTRSQNEPANTVSSAVSSKPSTSSISTSQNL